MRSPKVLILEDHPFQMMALHQMLNANHVYDVLTADSVDAAKCSLDKRGSVDIAICDLQMDGPDGLDFIRHLAETGQARALLVLSSTAVDVIEGVGQLAHRQGLEVLGCLQKPLSATALSELLATWRWRVQQTPQDTPEPHSHPLSATQLFDRPVDVKAIADQWTVHFQPKVNLDGDVLGVEALVRWQHPAFGLLGPGRFMDALERQGLLAPLTWRVLEQALKFSAATAHQRGEPMPVAVNIAPQVIDQPGFAARVLTLLAEHDVPASALTLEILEQPAEASRPAALEGLLRLRLQGCRVSIDDFGTGASNIQRLLQLPFNELKIPAQFVRGMAEDARKSAVVAAAMFMARRLALDVVVEGVETLDDFHSVMMLGSPAVQGYFIARPMAEADLKRWLAERERLAFRPAAAEAIAQDKPCSCK